MGISNETKMAAQATAHCLSGCAIGEISGMVITNMAGLATGPSVIVSIGLAFLFGYTLTSWPLRRAGLPWRRVAGLALASDSVSIGSMEIIDNLIMVIVPGAMTATLVNPIFWFSLLASLTVAFGLTIPVNRWLIRRGRGHALVHAAMGHDGQQA